MISNNLKRRIFTSIGLLLSVILIFNYSFILGYALIILGVLSILEFTQLTQRIFKNRFNFFLINLSFIIYIFVFCLIFFFFSNITGIKLILYTLLFGCIGSDIGGFIFGKIFKGPKLTTISPKKTYSGAIGSIILTISIITFLFFNISGVFNFKVILIAIMTSIFCQIGDLVFSFLKRKARLKDTGKVFPGHGGVLDRLDGILLGIPFGFLSFILFY